MAKDTGIQWCDDTVNPVAGCDGCELFETREQAIARIANALTLEPPTQEVLPGKEVPNV